MFDLTASFSRKDAAVLASRALTVYFLAWLVSELLYIPQDIYSAHYLVALASKSGGSYDAFLRNERIQDLCRHVIFAALAFLAAGWTYRCGAGVIRFLFPEAEEQRR